MNDTQPLTPHTGGTHSGADHPGDPGDRLPPGLGYPQPFPSRWDKEPGRARLAWLHRTCGGTRITPTPVGPFHAHTLIASHGQGAVYLATADTGALCAPVALKVLNDTDDQTRRRLERSIRAQTRVGSNRVPGIILYDLHAPHPWVAQEPVGPSLQRVVERHGPIPCADIGHRLRGAVTALADAHAAGVLHRDVKPSNVLLQISPPGLWRHTYLCDFDLAKPVAGTQLTDTGVGMGTLGFSAPEQLLGWEVTEASDVYALAATVVYTATGRYPGEVLTGLMDRTTPRPTPEAAELLGPLTDWVTTAMSFDPANRPELGTLLALFPSRFATRRSSRSWCPTTPAGHDPQDHPEDAPDDAPDDDAVSS